MVTYLSIALAAVIITLIATRKARAGAALLVLVIAAPLAGCVSVSPLATMDDVDSVRESIASAAEAQRDAYAAALAEGKSADEATAAAFAVNVTKQREAQASAKEEGSGSAWPLWAELAAIILGGGTAGTVLTRIVRGAPLRSGAGAAKAAKAATTA